MDEKKIFLKTVEEKYERFLDYYTMMSSDFLSLEQQSALAGFLRAHSKENVYLFGGYPEAERRQVLFLPDYTGLAPQESVYRNGNLSIFQRKSEGLPDRAA